MQASLPTPLLWTASVDYLRMTWRPANEYGHFLHDMEKMCYRAVPEIYATHTPPERRKLLGYEGTSYGEKLFYGVGTNGVLLQASGLAAQVVAERELIPHGVPRLDLQVTCWFDVECRPANTVLEQTRDALLRWRHRPWKVTHVKTDGGGETVYLGSRGKDTKYIRVYDKGAESGEEAYQGAYRFEVELTDTYAQQAYAELLAAGTSPSVVAAIVGGYLQQRGVFLPVLPDTARVPYHKLPKDKGAEERRRRWLVEQVKPAIQAAMAHYGWTEREVQEMLGIVG